jgi:hypothetical protein
MSIFGQGKPSGALGGASYSENEVRQQRDSDLSYRTKKAEFMDYLMDSELRQSARELGTAVNESKKRVIPSTEENAIIQNKQKTQAAKYSMERAPDEHRQALQKIHTAMTEEQYNNVSRAYLAFQDGIAAGKPAQAIYGQTRAEIIRASGDPAATDAWLNKRGITKDYTTDGVNALAGMAHYGLTDAVTTRAAYLQDREWQYKLEQEKIKASAAGKPIDRSFSPPTPDEIKATGDVLAKDVKYFDDLDGGKDDKGNYVGSQGALVSSVTKWAARANADLIVGDTKAFPTDYEMIASDILNYSREQVATGGSLWGWGNGGQDFNPGAFYTTATEAMNMLEIDRRVALAGGKDMPLSVLWKARGPGIMQQLRAADMKADKSAGGNPPKPPTAQQPPKPPAADAAAAGAGAGGQSRRGGKAPPRSQENPQAIQDFIKEISDPYRKQNTGGPAA